MAPEGTEKEGVRAVSEEGGVLVMVAIFLPVLLILITFVLDVGNWFAHRRHLQTQADAAALAGAGEFRFPCDDDRNAAIEEAARFYSGERAGDHNPQLGGTSPDEVHFALNSANYPPDGSETNPGPTDDTVVEGPACPAGMVDVKMTETDLPLFFQILGVFSSVDWINTHARVQIFKKERLSGGLPFAVPDPNPEVAWATFIDEATGEVLGSRKLERNGTVNDLALWDNATDPIPLTVDRERIGVRVALGGIASDEQTPDCNDPLVECYDIDDDNLGLLAVRGYSMAGSGAQSSGPPLARRISLYPGDCSDPYFFENQDECSVGVTAEVDFGPCASGGGLPPVGAHLTANVAGSNQDHAMQLVSCPAGSSTSTWETTTPFFVDADAGPVEFELKWEERQGSLGGQACKSSGNNPCKGSFGVVHRTYSAVDSRSGPVRFAQVWEGGAAWANSFERCSSVQTECTYDVVAKIGTDLNLEEAAQSVDDELVTIRFGQGSQNQTLDCDRNLPNLEQEIAFGCGTEYIRNQGTECPAPNVLATFPEPLECVPVQTGIEVGNVSKGMNTRVHGEAVNPDCVAPNHWPDFPDLPQGDPRIVPLFITPFGYFDETGNSTVPVSDFAVFYVTGWHNSNLTCPGDPDQGIAADDAAPTKAIVGHFINYVNSFNDGTAGEETCDFSSTAPCVAVLTE